MPLTDREIRRMYQIAYIHVKETLGYFPKPRLEIGRVPSRMQTHFMFVSYPEYKIVMQHNTNDDIYPSFLHELVHGYLEHQTQYHGVLFSQLCKKVGGSYSH